MLGFDLINATRTLDATDLWMISSYELDEISISLADHIREYRSLYIGKDTGFLSNVVSEYAIPPEGLPRSLFMK